MNRRDKHRAYHAAHREKRNAYSRAYRVTHKDEISAHSRAYREKHKDQISAKRHARYIEDRKALALGRINAG